MGNPLNGPRMNALLSSQSTWQAVSDAMSSNQIYYMGLLRNFYNTWVTQGYDAAKATLPDDDPKTPSINEGVTEEELGNKANQYLGKPTDGSAGWIPVPGSNTSPEDTNELLQNNMDIVKDKVRLYLGQKSLADGEVDALESQIKQLEIEQSTDTSGSTDPTSMVMPS